MGYLDGYFKGVAMRQNPALLQDYMKQREYERQQQQVNAQNTQRTDYLTELLGSSGSAAVPAQYEQQTQQVEGPMMPGQERGLMGVNQQVSEAQDAVEGSGILGGNMSPTEQAIRLMMSPTKETRSVGGQLFTQQAGRQAPAPYSNIRYDDQSGRSYGLTPGGQYALIPGQSGTAKPRAAGTPKSRYTSTRYDAPSGRYYGITRDGRVEQLEGQGGTPKAQEGQALDLKDRLSASGSLRDDFERNTADFRTLDNAYRGIANAEETGIGDVGMIFNIMKVFDPGSTVREGEVAMASDAAGVPARIRNMYNQAVSGRGLSPKARKELIGEAKNRYSTASKKYDRVKKRYTDIATRNQLDPRDIVSERAAIKPRLKDNKDGTFTMPDGRVIVKEDEPEYITRPPDGQVRRTR